MTKKIEIDDAMVRRAAKAYYGNENPDNFGAMRCLLDAALNPPEAEPDVAVTDAMLEAGQRAFDQYRSMASCDPPQVNDWWARLYRAMYRARPKWSPPCEHAWEPIGATAKRCTRCRTEVWNFGVDEEISAPKPQPQSPEPWRQHRRFNDPMDGSRFVNRRMTDPK